MEKARLPIKKMGKSLMLIGEPRSDPVLELERSMNRL